MEIQKILDRHRQVVEEGYIREGARRYRVYAISTLRGGVGKSTLAFNLAYEMSRRESVLAADLCAQRNLSETLLRDFVPPVTIYRALLPRLLGAAFGEKVEDVAFRISNYCDAFKGGKPSYIIPGDAEMFAFPSALYQQLQQAISQKNVAAVRNLLHCLKDLLEEEMKDKHCDKILLDTSPFYAGGTHLAWCAADAIIIPVRVDEHSIESLSLTLSMLDNPARDFASWNERAGGLPAPKVAAIVMTMAGSKSQKKSTPDSASLMYIERALKLAEEHASLFDFDDVRDAFVITDDFVPAGRISGAKSEPISQLRVGSFHKVEGKRLQVNSSATRYQKELQYLASVI